MQPPAQLTIHETTRLALHLGISIVPPAEDGSKRPLPNARGEWKEYQSRRSTDAECEAWYGSNGHTKRTGFGFACGQVSAPDGLSLNVLDFDDWPTYDAYRKAADAVGLGYLVERVENGYLEESPKGGRHWLVYVEVVDEKPWPCTKLAMRPYPARPGGQITLIETKCEGGFIVAAPSYGKVHPSERPYVLLRGGLESLDVLTAGQWCDLCRLAATFDETPTPAEVIPSTPAKTTTRPADAGVRPGEDFNVRATWGEILEGWTLCYTHGDAAYWRRPGKVTGSISATTNHGGTDRLKVFSSSTPFDVVTGPNRASYDKFGAYALLHHKGDPKAAAKDLGGKGYGEQRRPKLHHPDVVEPVAVVAEAAAMVRAEHENVYTGLTDEDLGILPLVLVECRPVRWTWKYRLAKGTLALTAGDGGIGKSQILLWMAAAVSQGWPWPDKEGNAPLGNVVIVSAEDNPEDTIKPRLMAIGADVSRIAIVKAKVIIRKEGKPPEIHPQSFQDRPYWQEVFRRLRPEMFIADPLPSYLGRGVNDSKNVEIRQVLEPFIDEVIVAADACMIGNTHLNKTIDAKAPMHRITGSMAYGNLPRNVHFVVRDPDDPMRRFFKQAKCNNAPDDLPAMAFRVERREIEGAGGEVIETAIPVWEAETCHVDLGAAVSGTTGAGVKRGPDPVKTQRCTEWLHDYLVGRPPTLLAAIFDAAGEAGLIGQKGDDGRWSGKAILYNAFNRVPTLPEPRDGKQIEKIEAPTRNGGKTYVHWQIVDPGKAF